MKISRLLSVIAGLIFASQVYAQDRPDWQTGPIVRATANLSDRWFATIWLIGNVREQTPNNFNVFTGFGYQGKTWWTEAMFQRQWRQRAGKGSGDEWMLDFRVQKQWGDRFSLYFEPTPFIQRKALYYFLVGDLRTWKRLNTGFEIENLHKAEEDSIGAGPRVSLPIFKKGKFNFSAALAYQFRRNEADVLRFYFVNTFRF